MHSIQSYTILDVTGWDHHSLYMIYDNYKYMIYDN
jgi:hypothetical protein